MVEWSKVSVRLHALPTVKGLNLPSTILFFISFSFDRRFDSFAAREWLEKARLHLKVLSSQTNRQSDDRTDVLRKYEISLSMLAKKSSIRQKQIIYCFKNI